MKKSDNIPLNYKEKNRSRISMICAVSILVVLFTIFRLVDYVMITKPAQDAARQAELERQQQEERANTPTISSASILAAGNNLYMGSILQVYRNDSGQWNFDPVYSKVSSLIQSADLALINQETILTQDSESVNGDAPYGTPTAVGDALVNAGFDVIGAATGHANDLGTQAIQSCLNFWNTSYPDIPVLGIHDSAENAGLVSSVTVNGIKIGLLNYTFGSGSNSLESASSYCLDVLEQQTVSTMIQQARSENDCVIFIACWGDSRDGSTGSTPSDYEKQWAAFLLQQGVDVLIGNSSVLQPYGRLCDDAGHSMTLFYSLGNFVSTKETLDGLLGGLAQFTIEKTVFQGTTTIKVLTPSVTPTVMHYSYDTGEYAVYPLSDYTDQLASDHGVHSYLSSSFTPADLQARFKEIMSANVTPSSQTALLNSGGANPSSGEDGSDENGDDEYTGDEDGYYDDGYYDDGYYDDGYYDDEYYDDGDDGYYDE